MLQCCCAAPFTSSHQALGLQIVDIDLAGLAAPVGYFVDANDQYARGIARGQSMGDCRFAAARMIFHDSFSIRLTSSQGDNRASCAKRTTNCRLSGLLPQLHGIS